MRRLAAGCRGRSWGSCSWARWRSGRSAPARRPRPRTGCGPSPRRSSARRAAASRRPTPTPRPRRPSVTRSCGASTTARATTRSGTTSPPASASRSCSPRAASGAAGLVWILPVVGLVAAARRAGRRLPALAPMGDVARPAAARKRRGRPTAADVHGTRSNRQGRPRPAGGAGGAAPVPGPIARRSRRRARGRRPRPGGLRRPAFRLPAPCRQGRDRDRDGKAGLAANRRARGRGAIGRDRARGGSGRRRSRRGRGQRRRAPNAGGDADRERSAHRERATCCSTVSSSTARRWPAR